MRTLYAIALVAIVGLTGCSVNVPPPQQYQPQQPIIIESERHHHHFTPPQRPCPPPQRQCPPPQRQCPPRSGIDIRIEKDRHDRDIDIDIHHR